MIEVPRTIGHAS